MADRKKKRRKRKSREYLENQKRLLDFMVFEWLSFGEKLKFDKNSRHML